VMENPKSALEIFKKRVPEIDLSIIEPNLMMGLELMKTERYARHGIGWIDDKKMCQSTDLVNTYMGCRPRSTARPSSPTNSSRGWSCPRACAEPRPPASVIDLRGVGMTYAAARGAVEALREVSLRGGR